METFATSHLARDHQHELRRNAKHHRLARQARRRSRAPVEDHLTMATSRSAPAPWAAGA